MKKSVIMLSLLIPLTLWGGNYDTSLLQIGAKLFPKIILIEKGMQERIQTSIHLVIVASPAYQDNARNFAKMLQHQYPDGINNYTLRTTLVTPKEALQMKSIHAFILMMSPEEPQIHPLVLHSNENKILTFCFDPALLKNGVLLSLHIEKSVKPYLNITALKQGGYTFEYSFIKLSTLFE